MTVHNVHLSYTLRAAHDTPGLINREHDQNLIFHRTAVNSTILLTHLCNLQLMHQYWFPPSSSPTRTTIELTWWHPLWNFISVGAMVGFLSSLSTNFVSRLIVVNWNNTWKWFYLIWFGLIWFRLQIFTQARRFYHQYTARYHIISQAHRLWQWW